jgi:malate:Na+ symporter
MIHNEPRIFFAGHVIVVKKPHREQIYLLVVMLVKFLAVAARRRPKSGKLVNIVPAGLEERAKVVFRFFVTAVTYPLLFATAVALTPWHELVSAFHPAILITNVATVGSLTATGYFVGRWLGMYPIDTAIVNSTHSGLGGTGDVMILTAAERMELLPFAQVATRIGGPITVTPALVALARLGRF